MVPFENTWPYEKVFDDIYLNSCPYCKKENILLPLTKKEVDKIKSGIKKLLVLPCCHESFTVIEMDDDYLLTDKKLR